MNPATVMQHFADQVYGLPPSNTPVTLSWQVLEEGTTPEGGLRRQLRLDLTNPAGLQARLTLLVHLPTTATGTDPVPAYCGMNFRGNHVCTDDPDVLDLSEPDLTIAGMNAGDALHYEGPMDIRTPTPGRGAQANRWPFDLITDRGYASITWCYLQLGPEGAGVFDCPAHRLFSDHDDEHRDPTEWGAIGIWAWSMSRVLDALGAGMVPEIDPGKVIAHGHSRLGKTALWVGANDTRFAAVISNDSGCTGATLCRPVGETPQLLARVRPYWYTPRFQHTATRWQSIHDGDTDPDLPDQPDLMRLIAPRPLYVASASEDDGADPEGEFLSWQQASDAWTDGPEAAAGSFPSPGTVIAATGAPLGYHLRDGEHEVYPYDWQAWLDFADRWVR